MQIIGIQPNVSFIGTDGNQVRGLNLYLSQPRSYVDGVYCEKQFIHESRPAFKMLMDGDFKVGSQVSFSYTRKGKIDMIFDESDD